MKKLLLSICCCLSACTSIPENLRVADGTPLMTFEQISTDHDIALGETARWGGVIAKVENLPDRTMLEVVNFSLKSSSQPKPSHETLGRFRVYSQGLLDPMIYKIGKSVTVVGQIERSEPGKIGEHDYLYPVLIANAVHLWKTVERYDVQMMPDPFWNTPHYWHRYPGTYRQGKVIIKKQNAKPTQPMPKPEAVIKR
jgi:outer membrane lipoprotein